MKQPSVAGGPGISIANNIRQEHFLGRNGGNQMANTQLFQTLRGAFLPRANAVNHEGAPAYALSPRHRLAQLAATGCLNQTFYADAQGQLDAVLVLAREVDVEFVAKTAVYARKAGHMKDMPALLLAILAARDPALLTRVFGRVIDNGKMLRNFVQILRSGAVGRKSLGTRPKKLVQSWLLAASEKQLLNACVGNAPSLADVVKMVHPKPAEAWRAAWFAWLLGKPFDEAALPPITRAFERYKLESAAGIVLEVPEVPFQMLTALELNALQWGQIARAGSWQMVRQNLNTFARHGVFDLEKIATAVAAKLRDPVAVGQSRVMPYQLMAAFTSLAAQVPGEIREALQDAMETALANVPSFDGRVAVCSGRVRIHEVPGDGASWVGHVERAMHRRRGVGRRCGAAEESIRSGDAVRAGGCRREAQPA
jgi:60 kDa SS-A/Ro ribonucleoprotein